MEPMCKNCSKDGSGTSMQCAVYGIPPSYYVRVQGCPFNPPETQAVAAKKMNPLKASKRAKKGK